MYKVRPQPPAAAAATCGVHTNAKGLSLVFTADLGDLIPPASLRQSLRFACVRAGIEPIGTHELRHTGVSLMILTGADQWQLMAVGGWKSLAMVQKAYGHLFPPRQREALSGLEALRSRRTAG